MKTVVIGTGRMGRRHILSAKALGLDVVAVCDTNAESLSLAASECDLPPQALFSSTKEALARHAPEVVVVATTAPTHAGYAIEAVEAGASYVFCEKPMAVSLAECDAMLETCVRRGTRLAINHQMRVMEQYTQPKELLASEAYGGLRAMTVSAGNFGLAMNATHYFEAFRFLTDATPVEATAWFSEERVPNPRGPQFEDRAGQIRLRTADGRRFFLETGADMGHGVKVIYGARNGQIIVDELHGTMVTDCRQAAHRDLPTTRYGMPSARAVLEIPPADALEPTRKVLSRLLASEDYPDGECGRLAVAVLVAAHLSNESGHQAIPIDDRLPRERTFPWS